MLGGHWPDVLHHYVLLLYIYHIYHVSYYVYIYIYISSFIYHVSYTYIYIYLQKSSPIYIMYLYIILSLYIYTHIYIYVHIYIHIYIYICVYIYICIYIYTPMMYVCPFHTNFLGPGTRTTAKFLRAFASLWLQPMSRSSENVPGIWWQMPLVPCGSGRFDQHFDGEIFGLYGTIYIYIYT